MEAENRIGPLTPTNSESELNGFKPKMFGQVADGNRRRLTKGLSSAAITRVHGSKWASQGKHASDEKPSINKVLLYTQFKVLFTTMKLMGLFFVRANNIPKRARWTYKVRRWPALQYYCIFVCFILFLNFIRSLTTFKPDEKFDTRTFFKILSSIFCYESASRALLSFWACHSAKCYQTLFANIDSTCYSDKIIPYENTLKSRLKFMLIVSMIITLANTGFTAFGFWGPADLQDLYHVYLRPFPLEDGTVAFYAFQAFYLAITFINGMVAMLTLSFYVVVCTVLHKEFQYLCRTFAMKIRDDGRFTDDIEKFRMQHEKRCQLVRDADAIFKYYIANTYLTNIPQLCLLLYMIVYSDDIFSSRAINSFKLFYVLVQMLGVSIGSILINTEAHGLLEQIYKISPRMTNYDMQMQISLDMFLNVLTGTSIGLSPWDIFVIDKAAMLTVFGMILTYFFLLMQFRPTMNTEQTLETCQRLLNMTAGL